jgi:hypothetical protein
MQIPAITPDYISPDARIKESDKPEKPEKKNLDIKNTKDQVDISTINHAVEQINKLLLGTFIFNNHPIAVEGGVTDEGTIHEIRGFH